jgi:hypothetical protein
VQNAAPPTPKEQWEFWGTALGVLALAFAVVRWPLWWTFQRLVGKALEKELTDMRTTTALASAHSDTLAMIQAAVEAHGIALRDVPRMSGAMQEMTRTLERLDETISSIGKNVLDHSTELGRVSGYLESGAWRGEERRRKGRRHEDPPQEGDS